jgi:hypothetical protein
VTTPEPDIESLHAELAAARSSHRQPRLLRAYAALAGGYLGAGRLDEAESAWRTSIQQARVCGTPEDLGRGLLGLARTLVRTARTDRALLAGTEAVACLRGRDAAAAEEAATLVASLSRVPGGAR